MLSLIEHSVLFLRICKYFSTIVTSLIMTICFLAKAIFSILNWKMFPLVNISATARQIALRCQQICYFPLQYSRIYEKGSLKKAHHETAIHLHKDLPSKYYPDYIRFYNTLWLIINDISFGLILSALLNKHRQFLAINVHFIVNFIFSEIFQKSAISLANNPFGIKLNAELGTFLSDIFLWIIDFSFTAFVKPLTTEKNLYRFIDLLSQITCLIGGSFGISIITDFFTLLSIPIYIFYHISGKLYFWQINIMGSLFYLFCGKKKNVLRRRVDTNYFQLDQLLVGTLFFIILLFLTPTILSFYIFYATLQMISIWIEIGLESIIAMVNHFPLFALLLRIKDPKRMPGGICIVSVRNNKDHEPIFELRSNAIALGLMFKPYSILLRS